MDWFEWFEWVAKLFTGNSYPRLYCPDCGKMAVHATQYGGDDQVFNINPRRGTDASVLWDGMDTSDFEAARVIHSDTHFGSRHTIIR